MSKERKKAVDDNKMEISDKIHIVDSNLIPGENRIVVNALDEFTANWLLKLPFNIVGLQQVIIRNDENILIRCTIKIRRRETEYIRKVISSSNLQLVTKG